MYKICVFGGTTEGRELVEFLNAQPCEVTACVATEYGQALLPEAERLTVSARRLPADEIKALLRFKIALPHFGQRPGIFSVIGFVNLHSG